MNPSSSEINKPESSKIEFIDLTQPAEEVRGDTEAVLSNDENPNQIKLELVQASLGMADSKKEVRDIMDECCKTGFIAKENGMYKTISNGGEKISRMIMDAFHNAMKRLNAVSGKNKPTKSGQEAKSEKSVAGVTSKPDVQQKPAETRGSASSSTFPYGIYMAGYDFIKTPEDAEALFRVREAIAGSQPELVKNNAKLRADYNERLAKVKEGIGEIIAEALNGVNKTNRIKSTYEVKGLSDILDRAVKRGILIIKNNTYTGTDYVDGAKELAEAANKRWAEILQLIKRSKEYSKVTKAENGFKRVSNGLYYAYQIKIIDTPLHRLIKLYNLTPEYPDSLDLFKKAVQDHEGMHIVGNGAPEFLIMAADELEKSRNGKKFMEFRKDSVKETREPELTEDEAMLVRESVAEAIAKVDGDGLDGIRAHRMGREIARARRREWEKLAKKRDRKAEKKMAQQRKKEEIRKKGKKSEPRFA